ncbi:hypothetical protein TSUD_118820 [Trifolium subterraneum]|uniref:Uncharacterized protein n=1 Tax=Trifolium subterraneum TaxID=3900 RepID=A0A2Z6MX31_TRISU|nr:hypothetical protein TSUD_118820 [Trifolium subterraneum]
MGEYYVAALYNMLQGFELSNSDGWMHIWQLEVAERFSSLNMIGCLLKVEGIDYGLVVHLVCTWRFL